MQGKNEVFNQSVQPRKEKKMLFELLRVPIIKILLLRDPDSTL